MLLSDDLIVIEALAKVCKDHHAELASTLIHIFCSYDRIMPLMNTCLAKSVDNEGTVSVWLCDCGVIISLLLSPSSLHLSVLSSPPSFPLPPPSFPLPPSLPPYHSPDNVSTLFRASTLSTMLMDQFMKLTALDYLRSILRIPVKQIIECPDSCEVQYQ